MLEEIKRELKRPATVVTLVIALISILISIATSLYFYNKSLKIGAIYYKVEQVLAFDQSSIIGNAGIKEGTKPLQVVNQNGDIINNNIYAANIKIWNGGSNEIRSSDVRSAIKIAISEGVSFSNMVMYGETNNNSDRFSLDTDTIKWEHFDPGDGFSIRLIYASKNKQNILVLGRVANSSGPSDVTEIQKSIDEKVSWVQSAAYGIGIFAYIVTIIFVSFYSAWRNGESVIEVFKGGFRTVGSAMSLIIILLVIVIGFRQLGNYFTLAPSPPF